MTTPETEPSTLKRPLSGSRSRGNSTSSSRSLRGPIGEGEVEAPYLEVKAQKARRRGAVLICLAVLGYLVFFWFAWHSPPLEKSQSESHAEYLDALDEHLSLSTTETEE